MSMTIPLATHRPWTLEEYHALPDDLPVKVDLVEGWLRVMSRAVALHNQVARRLANSVEACAPAAWKVCNDVDVLLDDDPRTPTEVAPDIVVFSAKHDLSSRPILVDMVALVIEVVSPNSRRKDRIEYPKLYAAAGILHYWRVETPETNSDLQIFTYRLSGRTYRLEGDYTEILKVEQPFPMTIDVPALAS